MDSILKLNDGKTEVVLFGTRQQMQKLKENDAFEIVMGVRNLGFYMESQFKSQQTAKVWHSVLTLNNVARICNFLTPE